MQIVVLKRFAQTWGGQQVKNDATVCFPLQNFDLTPWLARGPAGSEPQVCVCVCVCLRAHRRRWSLLAACPLCLLRSTLSVMHSPCPITLARWGLGTTTPSRSHLFLVCRACIVFPAVSSTCVQHYCVGLLSVVCVAGLWYTLNDNSVRESHAELQTATEWSSPSAYVLMYRLRGTAIQANDALQGIRAALNLPDFVDAVLDGEETTEPAASAAGDAPAAAPPVAVADAVANTQAVSEPSDSAGAGVQGAETAQHVAEAEVEQQQQSTPTHTLRARRRKDG